MWRRIRCRWVLQRRGLVLAGLFAVLTVPSLPAAEPAVSDDDLQIRGIFDSALPRTEQKHRLKIIVHPHLGDFDQREYIRMPIGLRYGLSSRLEVTGEVESYFSHGFGSRQWFETYGLSTIHVGTKYRIGTRLRPPWDTAVGIDYRTPTGTPPDDVSDGLTHISGFVTFSKDLERWSNWRVFWSVSGDEVATTGRPVTLQKNDLGDDSLAFTSGFVWQRKSLNYTLEATYATTRLTGGNQRDLVTVRPGFIWRLPKRLTFNSKGVWLFGLAARVGFGADGTDYGLGGKLRVSFDFKEWWRSHRGQGKQP